MKKERKKKKKRGKKEATFVLKQLMEIEMSVFIQIQHEGFFHSLHGGKSSLSYICIEGNLINIVYHWTATKSSMCSVIETNSDVD